jgi:DNA-binding PadR family transcriptional regulator
MYDKKISSLLPLTPVVSHILLAVADGPRHGYRIMQEVNRRSEGRVGLGPGTLYGAIQRMEDAGLLEHSEPPEGEKPEARRRYYAMTELGQRALLAETERLESLVAQVRQKEFASRAKVV